MTLGYREDRRRRRRRHSWTLIKWMLGLGVVAIAGLYAYDTGSRLAENRVARLQEEIADLTEEATKLKSEVAARQNAVDAARADAAAWRQRYEREIPSGEVKPILDLIRERLAAGISPERLRFVVGTLSDGRPCGAKSPAKRLQVETTLTRGRTTSVWFEGVIEVSATGEPAQGSGGNPESWFDPGKEVEVRIAHSRGKSDSVRGMLPLQQSIVIGETEYAVHIANGRRGFVDVTLETCKFP